MTEEKNLFHTKSTAKYSDILCGRSVAVCLCPGRLNKSFSNAADLCPTALGREPFSPRAAILLIPTSLTPGPLLSNESGNWNPSGLFGVVITLRRLDFIIQFQWRCCLCEPPLPPASALLPTLRVFLPLSRFVFVCFCLRLYPEEPIWLYNFI